MLVRSDVICGGWVTDDQRKGMWRKIAPDLVGLSKRVWIKSGMNVRNAYGYSYWAEEGVSEHLM